MGGIEEVIETVAVDNDSTVNDNIAVEIVKNTEDNSNSIKLVSILSSSVIDVPSGLEMISESSLSDTQKKLATLVYKSIKDVVNTIILDNNINNTLKITKVIAKIITHLENVKVETNVALGADKKAVAIVLGRILIKEVTPDNKGEAEILVLYDLLADQTLEIMINVSRVVNVEAKKIVTRCCPGILEIFRKKPL